MHLISHSVNCTVTGYSVSWVLKGYASTACSQLFFTMAIRHPDLEVHWAVAALQFADTLLYTYILLFYNYKLIIIIIVILYIIANIYIVCRQVMKLVIASLGRYPIGHY